MKDYSMFNYDYLFGDYMGKVSPQARLYYIHLNFYSNNGFVANPMGILDSMGYDKSVYQELVNAGELLTLPDRSEVFITSYFVHNKGLKPLSWLSSPFAVYWKGRLYVKKNGIATFTPQGEEPKENPIEQVTKIKQEENKLDWDSMIDELEKPIKTN